MIWIAPLIAHVIDRVPKLGYIAAYAKQAIRDKLIKHKEYIVKGPTFLCPSDSGKPTRFALL